MSKNKPFIQPEKYLSYIRFFISDWPEMIAILTNHLRPIGTPSLESPTGLISPKKINEALNGPLGSFFKIHLNAFLKIKRDVFLIRTENEPAFINAKKSIPIPTTMEDRKADGPARKQSEAYETKPKESIPGLDAHLKKLSSQLPGHIQSFQKLAKACYNESIKSLDSIGLCVNEFERQALFDDEPLSEIHKRYVSLNLKIPITDKKDVNFCFLHSLQLKLYLCIHSILSRLQQDNSHYVIEKKMHQLREVFKKCEAFEKKITKEQQLAISHTNKTTE